jgi:SAM-dependent methyltransferase
MPSSMPRAMAAPDQPVTIDAADLRALRCPLTGQELRAEPTGDALVTTDGQIRYPVLEGIICLTVEAAQRDHGPEEGDAGLHPVTSGLQRFYDDVGWNAGDEQFEDAEIFEDLRPVSAEYIHRCHLRVRDHLPASGDLLLDAGSGPVQFPEYLVYHEGFRKRLCVDISLSALRQARARLGDRGIYVQGDLTRLPLADGSVDAAVSMHVIYHVPAELQEKAFLELHRVLRPGGRAVVAYSWALTPLWRLIDAPNSIKLRAQRLADRFRGGAGADEETDREDAGFYFHPYSAEWFVSRPWPFTPRLAVWRLISIPALKFYIQPWLGGRWLLRALFHVESRWATQLGPYAAYPMIIIDGGSSDPR